MLTFSLDRRKKVYPIIFQETVFFSNDASNPIITIIMDVSVTCEFMWTYYIPPIIWCLIQNSGISIQFIFFVSRSRKDRLNIVLTCPNPC